MITFYKKTQAQYDSLSQYVQDGIYYITDSRVIYLNDVAYGTNVKVVSAFPTSGIVGAIYINSSTLEQRIYSNSAWTTISPAKSTSVNSSSDNSTVPTSKAVYDYVVTSIANIDLGTGGRLLPAVQDITALKAISDMQDKDIILIEDAGMLYRYDAQATDTADDNTVVTPTSGTGRWIKMFVQITYTSGNGITISNNVISLNADSTYFNFSNGVISFNSALLDAKISKVSSATANDVVTLNADGSVKDSGRAIGGATLAATKTANTLATELAVDTAITAAGSFTEG